MNIPGISEFTHNKFILAYILNTCCLQSVRRRYHPRAIIWYRIKKLLSKFLFFFKIRNIFTWYLLNPSSFRSHYAAMIPRHVKIIWRFWSWYTFQNKYFLVCKSITLTVNFNQQILTRPTVDLWRNTTLIEESLENFIYKWTSLLLSFNIVVC